MVGTKPSRDREGAEHSGAWSGVGGIPTDSNPWVSTAVGES